MPLFDSPHLQLLDKSLQNNKLQAGREHYIPHPCFCNPIFSQKILITCDQFGFDLVTGESFESGPCVLIGKEFSVVFFWQTCHTSLWNLYKYKKRDIYETTHSEHKSICY
jgi:hypothetical protein